MTPRQECRTLVALLLISTFAMPAISQTKAAPSAPKAVVLQGGESHTLTFPAKGGRWPELISSGETKPTVTWNCAQSGPDFEVGSGSYKSASVSLSGKQKVSSKELISDSFGFMKFCAVHQLKIENPGPGTLTVR